MYNGSFTKKTSLFQFFPNVVQIQVKIFACRRAPAAAAADRARIGGLPLKVAPPRRALGLGGLPLEVAPPCRALGLGGIRRELAPPRRRWSTEGAPARGKTTSPPLPVRGIPRDVAHLTPHLPVGGLPLGVAIAPCAWRRSWWATGVLPAYVDSWLCKSRRFPVCRHFAVLPAEEGGEYTRIWTWTST